MALLYNRGFVPEAAGPPPGCDHRLHPGAAQCRRRSCELLYRRGRCLTTLGCLTALGCLGVRASACAGQAGARGVGQLLAWSATRGGSSPRLIRRSSTLRTGQQNRHPGSRRVEVTVPLRRMPWPGRNGKPRTPDAYEWLISLLKTEGHRRRSQGRPAVAATPRQELPAPHHPRCAALSMLRRLRLLRAGRCIGGPAAGITAG